MKDIKNKNMNSIIHYSYELSDEEDQIWDEMNTL